MFIKTNNHLLKLMMSQQKSKSRCVYTIENPARCYRVGVCVHVCVCVCVCVCVWVGGVGQHTHKHWHLLAHLLAKPQREKL